MSIDTRQAGLRIGMPPLSATTLAAVIAELARHPVREPVAALGAAGVRLWRGVATARRGRVLAVGLATGVAVAAPGIWAGADESAVQRFLARPEPHVTSYRGYRRIDVYNARFKAQGWMEVTTSLDPASGLTWRVVAEGGSGYIRSKVIRKALETEVAAVRAGEPDGSSLTAANYLLTTLGEDDDGSARIRIEARRRDRLLVDGSIRVDAAGDLLEVRGRLAKTPSWWTTWVDVVRHYGRVAGIRVPVDMDVVSSVRVAGRSHLRVLYHFVEVNGRPAAPTAPPEWPPPSWASEEASAAGGPPHHRRIEGRVDRR